MQYYLIDFHTCESVTGMHCNICMTKEDMTTMVRVFVLSYYSLNFNLIRRCLLTVSFDFRYEDYPVTDVLQMVGRANRPMIDNEGLFHYSWKRYAFVKQI